jgi:formamidopyrimidine-DNA glycosylase
MESEADRLDEHNVLWREQMPELPEIATFARDMQKELAGRTISAIEVLQPKCLNIPEEEFQNALTGAQILAVTPRGKWLQVETTRGWLLLNLGMGGEILLTSRDYLPEKYRIIFDLADGAALVVNFWWFGHAHHVANLADHAMTAGLGPNALDLSLDEFRELLRGRRGGIKAFLLNQKRIAGIGNVYGQDPLFKAGIHPLRRINTLSDDEIDALYHAIRETLQESIDHGGSHWEQNLYGEHGGWDSNFFLVAYREGKPCPTCGTAVEKIKTGSTSTHICPNCQPLEISR